MKKITTNRILSILLCVFLHQILFPFLSYAEVSAESLEKDYGISLKWIEPETDHRSTCIDYSWENGVARVTVTDKNLLMRQGLIDTSGNTIAPFIYDEAYVFSEGKYFVSSGGSKIIIDASGNALFDASKYDIVSPITDGYSIVVSSEKYGMIDENGKELLPCEYDYIHEMCGVIHTIKGGVRQCFHKKGNPLNVKTYDEYHTGRPYKITKVKKDGKYGVIGDEHEEILPCVYDDLEICDDDIVAVFDKGWRYINLNDESNSYYFAGSFPYKFSDNLALVYSEEEGKYGYINKEWELVIPFKYSHAWEFQNGLAKVCEEPEAEKWYHIDKNGQIKIPRKDYNVMVNGEALIGINIISGYTGRIPPATDKAVLDNNGNRITEFIYSDIQPFKNGVAEASKKDSGVGLINKYGVEITPFGFFDLDYIEKNKYSFSILDTDTGITRAGILEIPEDASERRPAVERPITVYENGVDLYFDTPPVIINGRVLVPMRKIFETLGCEILWDSETNTVTAVKGATKIKLGIGENTAFVNDDTVCLDSPGVIRNNRTLVPIRFIADALDMNVEWDENMRRVSISEKVER